MAREIAVELPRTAYYTGEVIEGTVVVEASRDVSSRGLYVDFTGAEATVVPGQQGKQSRTYGSRAAGWSAGVCGTRRRPVLREGADRLSDHAEQHRDREGSPGLHASDRRGVGEGGRPGRDDRDVPDRSLRADGADSGRGPVHVRD